MTYPWRLPESLPQIVWLLQKKRHMLHRSTLCTFELKYYCPAPQIEKGKNSALLPLWIRLIRMPSTKEENWVKIMPGLNNVLENPLDALHKRTGFKVSSLLCLQKRTSISSCEFLQRCQEFVHHNREHFQYLLGSG